VENNKLPLRLQTCLKYTQGYNKLADIGTDHALLPIAAIKEGYVSKAQAIDNKQGPFVIAYSNVKKNNLQDKISVILGDGISKIDDDVDVVVISGMGGNLIANILLKHNTKNVKRFILQPNSDAFKIREILNKINFKIIDELIIKENDKLYDLLVIEKGIMLLNELDISFGPINLKIKSHFFIERINIEISNLKNIISKITKANRIEKINARIALLEEALK